MVTCEVCGGVEFEKYAGYLFCLVCQTQSQGYIEQEYEYRLNDTVRREKVAKPPPKKKELDDGSWTSWEAFNYILYGMTQELKCAFPLPFEFESLVLKLWAGYLKACEAAFISLHSEALPKLRYNFKHRDARVLYDLDIKKYSKKKKKRTKIVSTPAPTNTSITSLTYLRRLQGQRRKKVAEAEYKKLLAESGPQTNFDNETLETLGKPKPGEPIVDAENETDIQKLLFKCFKQLLSRKDYKMYKNVVKARRTKKQASFQTKQSVKHLGKNKLLAILHLALLIMRSDVQLSDLLRLIRESHLSFAKVTQFLPKEMKFVKRDIIYIDVINDQLMPTHLSQRRITNKLAHLLCISEIEVPNMSGLIKRYCYDLNLPDEIAVLSEKIVGNWVPRYTIPRARISLPGYEAWAMVSIIFVVKLFFGLNDQTEIFLSDLARLVNKIQNGVTEGESHRTLFVFDNWQKFIECRKTVLIESHYPTQEQLIGDELTSSKKFLQVLAKESKDEHRVQRFIDYEKYFENNKLMECVRQMLAQITKPIELDFPEFEPSLTPQSSYLDSILNEARKEDQGDGKTPKVPEDILRESFRDCSIDFALDPKSCLRLLAESGDPSANLRFYKECMTTTSSPRKSSSGLFSSSSADLLMSCWKQYWTLHYSESQTGKLLNFKEKILDKTPESFQWMIKECSRMLEMNVRDVYTELMTLEEFLMEKERLRDVLLYD